MNKFNKNSVEEVRTSEEGLITDVMMALSGREDYDPNKYDTEPERANMLKNIREKVVNQQKIMYGEETCEYDITWNGSPEGLYCIPVNIEEMSEDGDENNVEPCVCKVSDFTPTEDQLLGAVIESTNGNTHIIDEDFIARLYEDEMIGDGWIDIDFGIIIVYKPVEVYGLYIDQPGVYVWYDGSDSFVSRISNKYEKIKTINQKYLPEALQFGEEVVSQTIFEAEFDGFTYHDEMNMPVSAAEIEEPDVMPNVVAGQAYNMCVNGQWFNDLIAVDTGEDAVMIGPPVDIDTMIADWSVCSAAVAFISDPDIIQVTMEGEVTSPVSIVLVEEKEVVKTVDPKYLPAGIGSAFVVVRLDSDGNLTCNMSRDEYNKHLMDFTIGGGIFLYSRGKSATDGGYYHECDQYLFEHFAQDHMVLPDECPYSAINFDHYDGTLIAELAGTGPM